MFSCTTHLLYKYCINCTVYNWTVLAVITQKLLVHVQLHKRRERVQLLSFEAKCGRLLDTVCVYTKSYPEIRSFKEIEMTKKALPHPNNAKQHSLNFLSGDCKAAFVDNSSFRMGWRNSRTWRDRAWRLQTIQHTLTSPVWHSATAESAFLYHLPSSSHSHWAMPSTITQELADCGATIHCFYGAI